MAKKAKIKGKTNWSDKIVTGATIVGAIIFGRLFGFAGIGAAVAGWFVYNKLKNKGCDWDNVNCPYSSYLVIGYLLLFPVKNEIPSPAE